jgi:hypothetical protein
MLLPFEPFVDAWEGLRTRTAGVLGAVRNAAFWLAQRIGISPGEEAGAAAVSGGAAIGAKTAAACIGAVCVAAAGSGLVTVVAPIIPQAQHLPDRPIRRVAAKPEPVVRAAAKIAATRQTTSAPRPHATASPKRQGPKPEAGFTPGDLLPASTKRASTSTGTGALPRPSRQGFAPGDLAPASGSGRSISSAKKPRLTTGRSSSRPSCTPGDLGC